MKNELLGVDSLGRITGLNCHDGVLNMLDTRNKNYLKLGVRLVDGTERIFNFEDISRLYSKNFREGNIVDSFSVWPKESVPQQAIELALELSAFNNFSDIFPATKKNMLMLLVESSYGVNLCAAIDTFCNREEYINKKITIT